MVKKENKVWGLFLVSLLIVGGISAAFVIFDGENAISGLAAKTFKSTAESKVKVTGMYMNPKTNYLATVIKSEGKKILITSPVSSNTATEGSLSVYYPEATKPATGMLPTGEIKTIIGGAKNKKGKSVGGAEVKQDKTGKIISVKDKKGYSINKEKNKDKVVLLDADGSFYVGAGLNGKEIKDYSKLYFKEKEAKEWAEVVAAPSGFFSKLSTLTKSSSSKSKINSLTIEKKGTGLAQEFSVKGATVKEKTFLEDMMGYKKGTDAATQTQDSDCFCSQGSEGESFVDAALSMNPAEGGDLSSSTNPGSGCGGQTGGDDMSSGSMMGSGGLGNLGTGGSGKSSGKQGGSSSSKSSSGSGCDCMGGSASPISGKGSLCKGDSASAAIAAAADCIDQGKSTTAVQTGSPMDEPTLEKGKIDGEVEVHEGITHDVYSTGDYYKVTQINNVKTGASVTMISSPSSNGETFVQGDLVNDDITAPVDNPGSFTKSVTELMGGSTGNKNLDKLKVTMKDVTKAYYQKATGPKMETDEGKADSGTGKAQENYILNKLVEFLTGGSGNTGGQCDPDKGPCTTSGSGGSGNLGGTMITQGDPCETPQITGSLCENSGLYGKIVGMKDPSPIAQTGLTSLVSIGIDGNNGITCFKGSGNDPKDMVIIIASNGGVIMPMAAAKDFASQGGQEKEGK